MKRKQKNFLQKIREIFLQKLKALKKFFSEDISTPKPNKLSLTSSEAKSNEVSIKNHTAESNEVPVINETQLVELQHKAVEFHYLLDATAAWLYKNEHRYKKENANSLVKKWECMLGVTACRELRVKFSALQEVAQNDEHLIDDWFDFLTNLGLKQYVAQDEKIILTTKNRNFFENGRLYEDGNLLHIHTYPWLLNEELLIRGELYEENNL